MANLAEFWKGPNLVGARVNGVLVDDSDNITLDTTYTLMGVCESINISLNNEMESITPMDSIYKNNVIVERDSSLSITAFIQNNGQSASNILALMVQNYDIFQVQWSRGGRTYTYLGRWGGYSESLAKPKGSVSFTLHQALLTASAQDGSTDPTYVAPVTYV